MTDSRWARDAAVIALGLGTLLYPYGNMFVGHALAAAAAFGAFMLLDDGARRTSGCGRALARAWRLAGLLAGLTVLFEYQALLVSIALAVYAVVRYRRRVSAMAAFVAGALPPAFALGVYHTALFGRPWRFPFGNVENPAFARDRTTRPASTVCRCRTGRRFRASCFRRRTGCSRSRRCWRWASSASSRCSRAGRAARGATPCW